MKWKKLIDATNDDISRGVLLKFTREHPFKEQVVMMFCEHRLNWGRLGLITISGTTPGINSSFLFPEDERNERDWLVDHWDEFAPSCDINNVLIREELSHDEIGMNWKKFVDTANDEIALGKLIKFNSEYPFEEKVIMMFCQAPPDTIGPVALITVTGYKSGINPYFIFPEDTVNAGKIKDLLVDDWNDFEPTCNINDVLFGSGLNYDDI